jgi:hypothetical protein
MIITPEQAALKVQHQLDALRDFVHQEARDGQRIDTVEREVFRQMLSLGHTLRSAVDADDVGLAVAVEVADRRGARPGGHG